MPLSSYKGVSAEFGVRSPLAHEDFAMTQVCCAEISERVLPCFTGVTQTALT